MALELRYFVDKLLVSGFVVQDFFIEAFDISKQLRSEAAQLFSVELFEGSGRSHGSDFD